jgi:hypothetical protein
MFSQKLITEEENSIPFCRFAWAMWTSRNKMAIEKHLPKAPTDVIYIALSLIQRWSVNLKEKDQE